MGDNWELIEGLLAAEANGKTPRLFASRRTLFGIPSALDEELGSLADQQERNVRRNAGESGKAAAGAPGPTEVVHPLEPVFDGDSRVLILGTMPSPKSRETGFYYNHPQNRFWRVMAALLDEELPQTNDEKRALLLRHGIALWDVLARCTIEGASDGTIAQCVPNDIAKLVALTSVRAVFCTGAKATELYRKYCLPETGMDCIRLPSTSPANAAVSLPELIEAYRVILPHLAS